MNRPKQRESTLCCYTTDKTEIREGDILGYGDNYPCVVYYNIFEARFELVEFGYRKDNKKIPFRTHDVRLSTEPMKILGNIDDNPELITKKRHVQDFDYNLSIQECYNKIEE